MVGAHPADADDADDADNAGARARRALPVVDDLPGDRWRMLDAASDAVPSDPSADVSPAVAFPDSDVVASASSGLWLRDRALLQATVWVLADVAAAQQAEVALRSTEHVQAVAAGVATDLSLGPGDGELVGATPEVGGAVEHPSGGDGDPRRVRFVGGTVDAQTTVVLDLVTERVDVLVAQYWFADSPEPWTASDRASVVRSIRRRLAA